MGSSVLFIGNSFSVDTMQHVGKILRKMGKKDIFLGTLYMGACSVNMHLNNALENKPAYTYYTNWGLGWHEKPEVTVIEALKSRRWDWVVIQNGTGDGSKSTSYESLENLPALVDWVKNNLDYPVKTAFNMTWVGATWHTHKQIVEFGGDTDKMFDLICGVMKRLESEAIVDKVCPTGIAVQKAKKQSLGDDIYRDGYHLSMGIGRFIAGLSLVYSLLGEDISEFSWQPQGVTDDQRELAKKCAVEAESSAFGG